MLFGTWLGAGIGFAYYKSLINMEGYGLWDVKG
jgi:hypothetical protein